MTSKKHLSFSALKNAFSALLYKIKDNRRTQSTTYSLHDIVMSGFSCMYMQSPSLLSFQQQMQGWFGRNNLKTQFGVLETPADCALREGIDQVDSQHFEPLFKDYLTRLQRGGYLASYQFMEGAYLLPLDGTQYHSSHDIHCNQCLTSTKKNGDMHYSHKVVQAAIAHPDHKQVFPLMPEEIKNIDGSTKQDCEINAAKRLMPKIKKAHPRLTLIRTGDSLYAKQPFIEETLSQGDHFIFSVKPGDHKHLTQFITDISLERHDIVDEKGRTFIYEWYCGAPLNGREDTTHVNYFRCRLVTPKEDNTNKVTYIGSWITDLTITSDTIDQLVRGARCRWRIENECFNTLKNQGYCIDHNYGHGSKHLCFNFYILTLLAFYIHQILQLTDLLFQKTRTRLGRLKGMWEELRCLFNRFLYTSWESMMENAFDPHQRTFIEPQPP